MIRYTRTAAPGLNPVSTAELKANLREDGSDEDTLISSLISAATVTVEEMVGKQLVTQTWERKSPGASGKITIGKPPLISITSMTYFDTDDNSQTLTVDDFYLYTDEDGAQLEPKDGVQWPTFRDRDDALTITFTTGFGSTASDVPENLRHAITLLASHWFEHRVAVDDAKMAEVPLGVQALVGVSRKGWVAA